ncbi:hypothetical protein HY450_02310 [Candidatus Pacearchaeota archaeon]|nr:hypothetical protein [Candidatus Pacearchaeota archaeon]
MKEKGQSAVEFIILVGAVMFFFIAMLYVFQQNLADKSVEERNRLLNEIGLSIQKEIELASDSSEGYTREFKVPETLLNLEYTVELTESVLYIHTDDGKYALTLPVHDVTGQIKKGQNSIRKREGRVFLNE